LYTLYEKPPSLLALLTSRLFVPEEVTAEIVVSFVLGALNGAASSELFLHLLKVSTTRSNRKLMGNRFGNLFFLSI